jgi:outer membrane lipoprotein-sorting protein
MEIVDKTKPEHLRVAIDFLDWNLNAAPTPDLFTFQKPADAQQIDLLKQAATKK